MTKVDNVVEVEIDGPCNEHLFFKPLKRRLRGRFVLFRMKDPQAAMKSNQWPVPIPGKRIGVNLDTGDGYIVEGAHECETTKQAIEKQGRRLEPERETFSGINVAEWLNAMKRAVEGDRIAHVVKGVFPAAKKEEKPAVVDTNDRLALVLEKLLEKLEKLK